jgi:hypothetical protein
MKQRVGPFCREILVEKNGRFIIAAVKRTT